MSLFSSALNRVWHALGKGLGASFMVYLALTSGCAHIKGIRTTGASLPPPPKFLAGAAKVDITPPAGFPLGGHAIAASVGRGFWTRLHAVAVYFEDSEGHNLALVSCDLWSMPAGLADRVAELVAQDPIGRKIGRQSMILAATHTHQSPGNFSSSAAYNALASPSPGFDQRLFDYLARRICSAVLNAVSNSEPARIAFTKDTLPSASRNRSMPAFLLDPESKAILAANSSIPLARVIPEYPDPRASRAVDPRLRVLRVEGQHGLIALLGFLAMHPTALGHETEVYSADIFGIAQTLTEEQLRSNGATNVCVALFNGAEGDISPMWFEQDRADALKVGSQIAAALVHCADGGELVDGRIRTAFALSEMRNREFVDDAKHPRRTTEFAEGGAALLSGAEDGRTIYNYDGHVEGTRFTLYRTVGQGAKKDMLEGGLPFHLPKAVRALPGKALGAPKEVPLGVAQLGSILFATLPGEFTTVMGRRIEDGLSRGTPSLKQVILVGLANEYLSYFATPEEYEAQHYEGASTLYGPASGPYIQSELSRLALDCLSGTKTAFPLRYNYSPGLTEQFLPPEHRNSMYYADDGLAKILQDTNDRSPYRKFPYVTWNDSIKQLIAKMGAGQSPTPRVWVEVKQPDDSWKTLTVSGREENNEGLDFVTVTTVWGPDQFTWHAFWMPPQGIDKSRAFRLCATRADGSIASRQIQIPADCPLTP